MSSSLLCSCLVIGSILYLFSSYLSSIIDDFTSISPLLITTNKMLKERTYSSRSAEAAERSPLFRSLRMRYYEMLSSTVPQSETIDINQQKINVQKEEQYWKFMNGLIRNKTYNHMFEIEEDINDYIYILNINNDILSNLTFNPLFGQITLLRAAEKHYLKIKDQSTTFPRKESKLVREEQLFGNAKNPKQLDVCFQSYVPGLILHASLNQNKKDSLAVVYRLLTDHGTFHRVRIFNKLPSSCFVDDPGYRDNTTFQGQKEFDKAQIDELLYLMEDNFIQESDFYEDFPLAGSFSITAFNYYNGNTITYARYLDYYQYRIITRTQDSNGRPTWVETGHGPLIDRKTDKVFVCSGLQYHDVQNKPNLIVVSLRGNIQNEIRLAVEFQNYDTNVTVPQWQPRKRVYERSFPVHWAPSIYNNDIMDIMTKFSDADKKNKVLSLFGVLFLAFDWNDKINNTLVFETFKEIDQRLELFSVVPDSEELVMYSEQSHSMTYVVRDKVDPEQVMEDWVDIRLSHLPSEIRYKRILDIFLKRKDLLLVFLEGGVLASLKIELKRDDYMAALVWMDDDLFYGIIIPAFFALCASLAIYLKRRAQQIQAEEVRMDNRPADQGVIRNRPSAPYPPQRLENMQPHQGDEPPHEDNQMLNQDNDQVIQEQQEQQLNGDLINLNQDDLSPVQ